MLCNSLAASINRRFSLSCDILLESDIRMHVHMMYTNIYNSTIRDFGLYIFILCSFVF